MQLCEPDQLRVQDIDPRHAQKMVTLLKWNPDMVLAIRCLPVTVTQPRGTLSLTLVLFLGDRRENAYKAWKTYQLHSHACKPCSSVRPFAYRGMKWRDKYLVDERTAPLRVPRHQPRGYIT